MRKTIVSIGLIAAMSICFTACGGDTNAPVSEEAAATVAMTEPTTEMATEETTTEAIEDTSSMGMGDYYEYLGAENDMIPYTISPLAKDFINENPDLFPCADKEIAEEYTDSSIDFKMINKNQDKYGDKLICISEAYVIGINETNFDDGSSLTEVQATDLDRNYYYVIYNDVLDDIYQDDTVEIYGAPIGMTSFENVSGGTTISCVIAGSYVGKL